MRTIINDIKELKDEELGQITGGNTTSDDDKKRKHEIELGEFVTDALEYSEQENKSDITVTYSGENLNLLTRMNTISKKIIDHVSSGLTWEYKDGENRIHLLVK